MGSFGNSVMEYAKPLIDQTDGSPKQFQYALSVAQLCWNLSLAKADVRKEIIAKLKTKDMTDADFTEYCNTIIFPMIDRHKKMFPSLHKPK